jgi:hypothetical protein
MDKLISDDILHALVISDWQSEPYHQNQNFAENRYATRPQTGSLTGLVLQLPCGYLPLPMFVSFSTIWQAMLLSGYLQTRN